MTNWLNFNASQLLHFIKYVKQLEMYQHVLNVIDNVHSDLYPFVCKPAMNWTKKSNVNRLETLVSLLCHAPPSLSCYRRCYVKSITSTLVKLKICRTFTKTLVHYPICELRYPINKQSNHVSLEVEYCVKLKNTAAVMWTTLQTSMDMTLVYIFVSIFSWKMWIQPTCTWETIHSRLRHDMLVNTS